MPTKTRNNYFNCSNYLYYGGTGYGADEDLMMKRGRHKIRSDEYWEGYNKGYSKGLTTGKRKEKAKNKPLIDFALNKIGKHEVIKRLHRLLNN